MAYGFLSYLRVENFASGGIIGAMDCSHKSEYTKFVTFWKGFLSKTPTKTSIFQNFIPDREFVTYCSSLSDCNMDCFSLGERIVDLDWMAWRNLWQ